MGRTAADSCLSIDVNRWNREGWLCPGAFFKTTWTNRWRGESSVGIRVWHHEVVLSYKVNDKNVQDPISLTWTKCHYGGLRPWFECPQCCRRVGKLYMRSGYFRCRHCHDLTYTSCLESGKWDVKITSRVEKLRKKLGAKGDKTALFVYFRPTKPKGMHWETYWRLLRELIQSEHAALDAIRAAFHIP